ncbi:Macrolide export ATP-binding/permease protein MacB [Methanimicrococcus hongohii]|uniref:Macrolide export ATP-binding/permease protein MacB n=1 Tax=Methanimicrococcus hongohii TaxID=3028295 RepID=A0AA96V3K1_9EURY|nr:ABC transporter permease [Methanimicrococcus sp. Hf6]WNY24363.1 Macrolide export ATP-binding/permease protein MacB [Methanimicrococcus sp. Hf6]
MISLSHSMKMAVESLKSAKLRSGLTALGIIIGIAAVIATFTLGASFGAFFSEQISSSGSNYVMVMSTKENLFFDQQVEVVRNTRGVVAVSPVLGVDGTVTFMGEARDYRVIGVLEDYAEVGSVPMYDGTFISDQDTAAIVIGRDIAYDDYKNTITTRSSIEVTIYNNDTEEYVTRMFRVKGISGSENTSIVTGADSNTGIYIPIAVMKEMSGRDDYPSMFAMTESNETVKETDEEIERNLARNLGVSERNLDNDDLIPFRTMNQVEILEQVSSMTQTMQLFLIAIGGISLVVGSVGIMNIMIVTVTERTKEIGTLKALGYTSSDVLSMFLVESVVISLIGGAAGTVLGLIISYIGSAALGITMSVSFGVIVGALIVSVVIGVIAGVYPAKRAADMNPVDALRTV